MAKWLRRLDLHQRPSVYETDKLTTALLRNEFKGKLTTGNQKAQNPADKNRYKWAVKWLQAQNDRKVIILATIDL